MDCRTLEDRDFIGPLPPGYYTFPVVDFDPGRVDWVSVGIDVAGGLGEVVKPLGLPGLTAYGVSEAAEIAGAFKDAVEGDVTGIFKTTTGVFLEDLAKLVLQGGGVVNAIDFFVELDQGWYVRYESRYATP
jgi:hypothetical protein